MDVEVKDPLPVAMIAPPVRMFDLGASLDNHKTLEIKERGNFFMRQTNPIPAHSSKKRLTSL